MNATTPLLALLCALPSSAAVGRVPPAGPRAPGAPRPVLSLPSRVPAPLPPPAVPAAAPAAPVGDLGRAILAARAEAASGAAADGEAAAPVENYEGVRVIGRAAQYFREVDRLVRAYRGVIDFDQSLDVMDDSYGDVVAKVTAVEALAGRRRLEQENVHLKGTLTFVDGVLDDGGRRVAVHTHRVYFHRAADPASEIEEGIRRVDGWIREARALFAPGGAADKRLGALDGVELVFDARGHDAIKRHLRARGAEVEALTAGRIRFHFLDELATVPRGRDEVRARLNELTEAYRGRGLEKIVEGVTYSRYVGLLLELKTMELLHRRGHRVLQSGREVFDAAGRYVTELDAVVRAPDGRVLLVEAKSARVALAPEKVLADKVVRKLETYRRNWALLEESVGERIDGVVFAMDAGRQKDLPRWLRAREAALSAEYGVPVEFLFLRSAPGVEPVVEVKRRRRRR